MTRQGRSTVVASALAALALALAVAGCGEDEAASDEFVTEMGALCEESTQEFAEANADLVLRDATYSKQFRDINKPLYDDYLAQLEAVEPPEGKEDAYDAYVAAIRKQSEVILDDPLGPARANLGERETAVTRELAQLNEDAVAAGQELGLPAACTTGSSESTGEPAPPE